MKHAREHGGTAGRPTARGEHGGAGPRSTRKQLRLLIATVVLVGVGGWFAGTQVHSPADVAASREAPEAGPVTVAVERRPLTAAVVATGSVEFASPSKLSLAGAVGTGAAGNTDGGTPEQRVTKPPVVGATLKEGSLLMEVSGRPVFVVRGTLPMYRTLGPGTSGEDVTQLQQALRRLGFDPGSISGTYRQGTASAVTRWYSSKGQQPQKPGVADEQQLGVLRQAVYGAQEALLTAEGASGGGDDGPTQGKSPGSGPSGNGELRNLQLRAAREGLDSANAALSAFQAAYGTKVPAGEVVFLPHLPVRVDKAMVRAGDVPSGPVATVTGSDLVVQAVVTGTDAQLLRPGMAVQVETPDGKSTEGAVASVGGGSADTGEDAPGGDTGTAPGKESTDDASEDVPGKGAGGSPLDPSAPVQVTVSVPDPGPLAGQAGAAVKVTVKVGASKGPVLTAPVAAIHTSADGQARVQVQRDGQVVDLNVTVGLSSAGFVEVKPRGGALKPGDRVVVGR